MIMLISVVRGFSLRYVIGRSVGMKQFETKGGEIREQK